MRVQEFEDAAFAQTVGGLGDFQCAAGAIERASWSLGRELARARRIDGASPLALDSDGTVFRKGDMVFYRDGTEHNSHTPNGCLLAVHIVGPEFTVE